MSDDSMTAESIIQAISGLKDPESGREMAKSKQLDEISIDGNDVSLRVTLASHSAPLREDVAESISAKIKSALPSASNVNVDIALTERTPSKLGQIGLTARSVIAVGSGKGGVGKSTVATNLALSLKKSGCRVGLLDTDVYGPSVPQLLGLSGQPAVVDNQVEPIEWNGMPVMSIGFLVPADQAVIWRGPMLHKYVGQFLGGTRWGDLDYLIIDMPPGTGDIALSLSQMLPITGAVVVCTPQDVALLDAIKAVSMFRQVKIPILGVVENMSGFVCPGCGTEYDIFGKGGAREYAEAQQIPFLGELPIHVEMRKRGDSGESGGNLDDPQIAPQIDSVAYQLVRRLADETIQNPPKPQLPVLG